MTEMEYYIFGIWIIRIEINDVTFTDTGSIDNIISELIGDGFDHAFKIVSANSISQSF